MRHCKNHPERERAREQRRRGSKNNISGRNTLVCFGEERSGRDTQGPVRTLDRLRQPRCQGLSNPPITFPAFFLSYCYSPAQLHIIRSLSFTASTNEPRIAWASKGNRKETLFAHPPLSAYPGYPSSQRAPGRQKDQVTDTTPRPHRS